MWHGGISLRAMRLEAVSQTEHGSNFLKFSYFFSKIKIFKFFFEL